MYKAQEEAILSVRVIVGNLFLTMRVHLYKAQEEVVLYPGFLIQGLSVFEYPKVGHYVPKGFLTMNLEKVTRTCPMLLEACGSLYIKAQEEAGELLRSLWVLVF